MNSYIVIEPKDIDEKVLIFNFLGSKTTSKFTVTYDLKEYVSKLFRVKFIEDNDSNILPNHQSGVGNQVQQITIPSTDTVMTDLVPKTEEVTNSDVPFHTDIPLVDNTVSLTTDAVNTDNVGMAIENGCQLNALIDDDHGTYVPYRERMVEPKKEIVDDDNEDIIDKNKDGNTEETSVDVMPIDDVLIPDIPNQQSIENENSIDMEEAEVGEGNNSLAIDITPAIIDTNAPSASTTRKSGRIVKRPRNTTYDEDVGGLNNTLPLDDSTLTRRSGRVVKMPKYLMDDEDFDKENESNTTENKSTTQQPIKKGKMEDDKTVRCQKCLKLFSVQYRKYSKAKLHAITHTDLERYECPVNGCEFKSNSYQRVHDHIKIHHKGLPVSVKKHDLTTEQEEELSKVTEECFHESRELKTHKKCTVCHAIIAVNSNSEINAKRHALPHIGFMLYKCNQINCCYESRYYEEMVKHVRKAHRMKSVSKEDTAIELTDDQKKMIDDIMKKCYPDEEEDNDV